MKESIADKDYLINKWAKMVDEKEAPATMQAAVKLIVPMFDQSVSAISDPLLTPNESINKLGVLFWRLVGNKVTPTALSEMPLKSLHVWCEIKGDQKLFVIMVPIHWPRLCQEDPLMQLGGVVYTASKAADYWHGKIGPKAHHAVEARAMAYEAYYEKKRS